MSCMFYFGDVLLCPPYRASVRDSRSRVLQYVHDSLIVGCLSDRSFKPSIEIDTYRIERGPIYLIAMVVFYLNER